MSGADEPTQLFISYSNLDAEAAQAIQLRLKQRGVQVYLDALDKPFRNRIVSLPFNGSSRLWYVRTKTLVLCAAALMPAHRTSGNRMKNPSV
jgi:hypothetical protein